MSLLEAQELSFGYAGDSLFEGVGFRLNTGERASLVAPNGSGKTTLLRILARELEPDRGIVVLDKSASLGFFRQSHELSSSGSVMDALLGGFGDLLELRHELAAAQHQAATGSERDLEALARATDRYHARGADALEHRVESLASRLGFSHDDLERPVSSLSGGERGRLHLLTVLATEPDVLLLDEPTNHLDIDGIRWLENHLTSWRGAILCVSHDRAFLDAVCPITMELGKKSFRIYPLAYSAYQAARAADLERERGLAEQQSAFIAKTEDFIRRNIAGQKTKQAQSRRKMLDRLERRERPEDVWASAERIRFRFAEAPRSGDIALEAKGLHAGRGGADLFEGVDLLVRRGDRIGIVGPNGCGKSTLLRLLAGYGTSEDGGSIRRGTNLCEGYFDQNLGSLEDERSAIDEIRSIRGDLNTDGVRQYLARFRFYGDDPFRRVESLSGGERTRLALAKLLLEPRNLLFLDEPTNHLDIPATEILEQALVDFPGTVLLVSHDRRFLETVTTRTLCFRPEGIDIYEGGFADYTEALERQHATARAAAHAAQAESERRSKAARSEGAERHRQRRAAQGEQRRKHRRLAEVERLIREAEIELGRYKERLLQADGTDWEQLHSWAKKERALNEQLEGLMSEWVTLSDDVAENKPEIEESDQ